MNTLSKIAIVAVVGVAGPLALSGAAVAGPFGAAASAVASFDQPIERVHYSGYGHRHHHFAPAYAHYRASRPRPYPYHTYVSPYRYHAYAPAYRQARAFGFGYQPHYRSVAPSYSAAPITPYFTGYSPAGTVSYPVYRVDHYKVDYANPIVSYSSECCGW
ncbi:hypothetical protein [Methylosinus sp. Sm6]|uniref:hypothetical protein n=1 Tax=Methylosinus sp. Sm6 TaxID=2866948 RepID=UPI001C99E79D|nr:hypothetical protein [Methylosinus sp. Sm6]MBY6240602.1 hypothetical protein [Methylosinus sp. Sm6]